MWDTTLTIHFYDVHVHVAAEKLTLNCAKQGDKARRSYFCNFFRMYVACVL